MGRKPYSGTLQFYYDGHYSMNRYIYAIDGKGNGWTYVNKPGLDSWQPNNTVARYCQSWLERGGVQSAAIETLPYLAQSTAPYGT